MRRCTRDGLAVELNVRLFGEAINQHEAGMVKHRLYLKGLEDFAGGVDKETILAEAPKVVNWGLTEEADGASLDRGGVDGRPVAMLGAENE